MKKTTFLLLGLSVVIFVIFITMDFETTAQKQNDQNTNSKQVDINAQNSTTERSLTGEPAIVANDGVGKTFNVMEIVANQTSDMEGEDAEPAEAETYLSDPLVNKRPVPSNAISPPAETSKFSMYNQTESPQVASPPLSASFQALPDSGTSIPPDTHGAVGPNHIMTVLNSQVRIQNKAGAVLATLTLNSFWGSLSTGGVFDPKLLYDPYTNRWLFTSCVDAQSANNGVLFAYSATNDPTGNWTGFRIKADTASTNWADYPSFGFNKDWVAISMNMFTNSSNQFVAARTFLIRKAATFTGTLSSTIFNHASGDGFTLTPAITYSNTEPTLYLLSTWNGNFQNSGYLRLYTITGAVGAEVFTPTNIFPNSGGNTWNGSSGTNFAPQSGTATGINTNDNRMQNVLFRNGSLWATHSAFTPGGGTSTRAAVQWWQINPTTGATTQFGKVEDLTNAKFYAFPSLAVNQNNDMLIGYATFSATTFGSAGYSFRAAGDAPGTLRDTASLKAGLSCYVKTFGGSSNRWGDYSNTAVDPSDDTSFWTVQEYADTVAGGSCANGAGKWATWWGKVVPPTAPTANRKPFDFDGDGRSDVSVFRPSNGTWYLSQSQNGFTGAAFGASSDLLAPADFDGDGKTDIGVFRSGAWYYMQSSTNSFVGLNFGQAGDLPRPADFDGDNKADVNVFRPSNGAWYRLNSSNGSFSGMIFGQNGDKPLIANFDGDNKADIAVFRPSAGAFYWMNSSTGGFQGSVFGFSTDIPTMGDFDGDGKTDIAVFRPSNGSWYRFNSSTGQFAGVGFGQNGDIPVTADYDGDGRSDVAVFRPSAGAWYYLSSSNGGFVGAVFGASTDKPVPAAFQ